MANRAGKNIDFPGLVAKGENPAGLAVQAPSGTYYPNKDGAPGGDGCEFHWQTPADGERWGHNPMPCRDNDPFSMIPSALPISRKLKK
jgi:hypothetical protein